MKRSDISDLDCVKAAQQARESGFSPNAVECLRKIHPEAPDNVLYAALERTADRDLIEYGTSIRGSWPTEKGEKLLETA